jgi:hypothetical protein
MTAGLATAVALGAVSSPGGASTSPIRSVVHFPAAGAALKFTNSCFWGVPYTEETRDIIWPDSHTGYWYTSDVVPAGGKIVLHGQFPHARFFSFTATSTLGVTRAYLYDVDIKADPGSTNPFMPGANRNAAQRSYTVTVVDEPDPGPGHRQQNVLYAGTAGQASGAGRLAVTARVYLPDRGRDWTGGVGVPTASYAAAGGTTATGNAACAALGTQSGASNITNINQVLFPETKIEQLLAMSSSPTHPAVDPVQWYKYWTPQRLLEPYYAGTTLQSDIATLPTTGTGLGANPANGYVTAWLDRTIGPNPDGHNIAVLHGKLPTTPATYNGEAKMQGGTQLRYWSLCNNEGLASGKTTGPCLSDEEVPTDAQRDYTIVISLPQDRPANATDKCGVAWMNWGTTGDGFTRPTSTLLILRNLATTSTTPFTHSVQDISVPGTEKQVMGPYLPTATYTDKSQFQKLGCK